MELAMQIGSTNQKFRNNTIKIGKISTSNLYQQELKKENS